MVGKTFKLVKELRRESNHLHFFLHLRFYKTLQSFTKLQAESFKNLAKNYRRGHKLLAGGVSL